MSANRKAYIVGLTGGIASGKSEAARHLSALGACCVDADAISHALTAPGGALLGVIRETFGDEVFLPDGTLNRRALGEVVFNDPAKRLILDSITHPAIQKAIMDDIERAVAAGENLVFINVPLLFETGMDALCDETWLISLDRATPRAGRGAHRFPDAAGGKGAPRHRGDRQPPFRGKAQFRGRQSVSGAEKAH